MASYNKLDKINALVALELNDGNVLQTAKELGVSRPTLYAWQEQLENDVKLLAQVEAAKANMANIEELLAMKAQAELSRRLDEAPSGVKAADLIKLKDSGINNSRLIRGQSTSNTAIKVDVELNCRQFVEMMQREYSFTLEQAAEALRRAEIGVSVDVRERVARQLVENVGDK